MLSLDTRIDLLVKLGSYMLSDDEQWVEIQHRAELSNSWFTREHIELAVQNIAKNFLQRDILEKWIRTYQLPDRAKVVGIVMAGNIPLVGFHDFMCGFISGHDLLLKLSSKDQVLLRHLISKLVEWEPEVNKHVQVTDILKGCDAYITTSTNNTSRYFEQYFGKYPNIIRKNRTSVAVLNGTENEEALASLADDIFLYYGLGCRNVTQLHLPKGYDFEPLLKAFKKYEHYIHHHKYKNNYDYHLALYLLNRVPYRTNESVLLVENALPFSAVSVLHYQYYDNIEETYAALTDNNNIQCIVSERFVPFGKAQSPDITDYADKIDTMKFLCTIS